MLHKMLVDLDKQHHGGGAPIEIYFRFHLTNADLSFLMSYYSFEHLNIGELPNTQKGYSVNSCVSYISGILESTPNCNIT